MKATAISASARRLVQVRDRFHCVHCGAGTVNGQWHHRRSRSIRDELTHSPANGVYLDSGCHSWLHAHPFEARAVGLIVSRYAIPTEVPFLRYDNTWILPDCNGFYRMADAVDIEDAVEKFSAGIGGAGRVEPIPPAQHP